MLAVNVILSSGIFSNLETASLALPGVCARTYQFNAIWLLHAQKSSLAPSGLCARNGHWYSAFNNFCSIFKCSFHITVFSSHSVPHHYSTVKQIVDRDLPCFQYCRLFHIQSSSSFLAFIISHVDLPTTATLFLKVTTSIIPGIALAAACIN